jgi:peptidyl-tRNA hydrolase, PTH1 family
LADSLPIRLIAGLGNPGAQYLAHRHNVGFWVVDQLASMAWSREAKFKAEMSKVFLANDDRWLMKPGTFMNASGQAVGAFARFHRLDPAQVLVIHDELDLAPGSVRVKQGGGHGGHNGIRDIESHLGSPNFWRIRIGVGHPRVLGLNQDVADFVLHAPRMEEKISIDRAIDEVVREMPAFLSGQIAAVQKKLHSL